MAMLLDCSWDDILRWRVAYAAWHCTVTGRVLGLCGSRMGRVARD